MTQASVAINCTLMRMVIIPRFRSQPMRGTIRVAPRYPLRNYRDNFPILIRPMSHRFTRIYPYILTFTMASVRSRGPLRLGSILHNSSEGVTFLVYLTTGHIFRHRFNITIQTVTALHLYLIPPVATVRTNHLSTQYAGDMVSSNVPRHPFYLFLHSERRPPINNCCLVLGFYPYFRNRGSGDRDSI